MKKRMMTIIAIALTVMVMGTGCSSSNNVIENSPSGTTTGAGAETPTATTEAVANEPPMTTVEDELQATEHLLGRFQNEPPVTTVEDVILTGEYAVNNPGLGESSQLAPPYEIEAAADTSASSASRNSLDGSSIIPAPSSIAQQDNWGAGMTDNSGMLPAPSNIASQSHSFHTNPLEPVPNNAEEYLLVAENNERNVSDHPLLTFSLKVDTASYRNIVRHITSGHLPPSDAVRIEEMINYFNYDEILPENKTPFSIYTEIGPSPFNENNEIAFVRVKSKEIDRSKLPPNNLTFLIDTSGSMATHDKMPLLKSSLELLVDNLTEDDIVSIVTYAGNSAIDLDSVSGDQQSRIMDAINGLVARGSTAGGEGIETAYRLAEKNFNPAYNNRILLATDGDFNVGVSSVGELEKLIAAKRQTGVYLTILGFGTENLKDNKMETLAKNGNGNYSYIDTLATGRKVLVDEMGANLYTIADDVKAQIEFNPVQVSAYRLIGYENRVMPNRDFNDDTKDAGEIGVGTDVVLMFEITRTDNTTLRYQRQRPARENNAFANELFVINIRYKNPGEDNSQLIKIPVTTDRYQDFNSSDFNFAVSVAGFGHLLKDSYHKGMITPEKVQSLAINSLGKDRGGHRMEYLEILEQYRNGHFR